MFNSVDDLRDFINQGYDNEEIIKSRIDYLESNEYRASRMNDIMSNNGIVVHDGYISNGKNYSSIYNKIVNLIRNNMDKKGFNIRLMIQLIQRSVEGDSKFKPLLDFYLDTIPSAPNFGKDNLPYILRLFKHSHYDGNFTEFGKAYLYSVMYQETENEDYKIISEKFNESIDWDKIDDTRDLEIEEDLASLNVDIPSEEYAQITQNILSFLGYDVFLINGLLNNAPHSFNVLKTPNGEYKLIDAKMDVKENINGISNQYELTKLNNITINSNNKTLVYSSGMNN